MNDWEKLDKIADRVIERSRQEGKLGLDWQEGDISDLTKEVRRLIGETDDEDKQE